MKTICACCLFVLSMCSILTAQQVNVQNMSATSTLTEPNASADGASPAVANAMPAEKPDLSKQPTLYVVGYAHLDTEWRWEYPQVIDEYIRKTMEDNFQ